MHVNVTSTFGMSFKSAPFTLFSLLQLWFKGCYSSPDCYDSLHWSPTFTDHPSLVSPKCN